MVVLEPLPTTVGMADRSVIDHSDLAFRPLGLRPGTEGGSISVSPCNYITSDIGEIPSKWLERYPLGHRDDAKG